MDKRFIEMSLPFATYLENHKTKVKPLTKKQKEKVLDFGEGVFFNLEKLLEG